MTGHHHWDYYGTLEADVEKLARFIHFSPKNLAVFSVELARLLMTCTQEVDVLLKQICQHYADTSRDERGYRGFLPSKHPKMAVHELTIIPFQITFTPFKSWSNNQTPKWWTANNKIKHERHNHFELATLGNVLEALTGLFIANLYFAHIDGTLEKLAIPVRLVRPEQALIKEWSIKMEAFLLRVPK